MRIKYRTMDKEVLHKIDHILEIELACGSTFRLRDEYDKLRMMTRDGYLILEPVASNVVLLDQKEDI